MTPTTTSTTPRLLISPQLEKERVTELGTKKAAELEVTAPTDTAAAAAASGCGGGCGGEESGCARIGCARSGVMSGMEVLWDCVQDDAPGDARYVVSLSGGDYYGHLGAGGRGVGVDIPATEVFKLCGVLGAQGCCVVTA